MARIARMVAVVLLVIASLGSAGCLHTWTRRTTIILPTAWEPAYTHHQGNPRTADSWRERWLRMRLKTASVLLARELSQGLLQCHPQLGDGAEPLGGVFLEAALDDFVHALGQLRMPVVDGRHDRSRLVLRMLVARAYRASGR